MTTTDKIKKLFEIFPILKRTNPTIIINSDGRVCEAYWEEDRPNHGKRENYRTFPMSEDCLEKALKSLEKEYGEFLFLQHEEERKRRVVREKLDELYL